MAGKRGPQPFTNNAEQVNPAKKPRSAAAATPPSKSQGTGNSSSAKAKNKTEAKVRPCPFKIRMGAQDWFGSGVGVLWMVWVGLPCACVYGQSVRNLPILSPPPNRLAFSHFRIFPSSTFQLLLSPGIAQCAIQPNVSHASAGHPKEPSQSVLRHPYVHGLIAPSSLSGPPEIAPRRREEQLEAYLLSFIDRSLCALRGTWQCQFNMLMNCWRVSNTIQLSGFHRNGQGALLAIQFGPFGVIQRRRNLTFPFGPFRSSVCRLVWCRVGHSHANICTCPTPYKSNLGPNEIRPRDDGECDELDRPGKRRSLVMPGQMHVILGPLMRVMRLGSVSTLSGRYEPLYYDGTSSHPWVQACGCACGPSAFLMGTSWRRRIHPSRSAMSGPPLSPVVFR